MSEVELKRDWMVHVTSDGELIDRSWANVRAGLIGWHELDAEEITRGKLRNRDGTFRGHSRAVPKDLQRAVVQEHIRRVNEAMRRGLDANVAVIRDIADGSTFGVLPSDQLKAAIYLMERTMGKVPDKVELTATIKPWEDLVAGILVDADIVDAEVVEDEPQVGADASTPAALRSA